MRFTIPIALRYVFFTLSTFISLNAFSNGNDTLNVSSPNNTIKVSIWKNKQVFYKIYFNNKSITKACIIDLEVNNKPSFSNESSFTGHTIKYNKSIVENQVPERSRRLLNEYNEIKIQFKAPYTLQFRVFNNGVAYQIGTKFKDSIFVKNEIAKFNFENKAAAYIPLIHKRDDGDIFHTSFEELYPLTALDSISSNQLAYNPVLVSPELSPKIAITESDLLDYPGMFLAGSNTNGLEAKFAPYPEKDSLTKELYPELVVTKRANYIANTKGTRNLPWRILMIAPEDKDLPINNMVYLLATPADSSNFKWVQPGKATDEWIININLFNVPFKAGINTATYKYYIDFCKRFGFDRIMMDAGWSDYKDLFKINPEINMDEIAAYAKSQNIKISMWTIAVTLDKQLDSALDQFNKWGVDFIMTDFIDRDDQKMVQFYERIAKACLKHKIMIMYHGAYAPKGFNRTYPNAITREGVLGSEYSIWSDKVTPSHNLILPFTRMLAGSMDYEPGYLNNATKASFRNIEGAPMSYGTRCHQLAMFIVYDSPMQIFSGNPSQAYLEPEFMELLGSIPTGWDETKILDAKVGEYIVTARKQNDNWYIAGMNDWNRKDQIINLDFLDNGNYKLTICKDGMNAEKFAADYTITKMTVTKKSIIKIHAAPGGGFMLKLIKE
jgi:alpha-glucosidase